MAKETRTHLIGRNAEDGKFVPVEKARDHPKTYVVERLPNPGHGDTKKK